MDLYMLWQVFIQNEAGSDEKHYHDEKTLEWRGTVRVSRPYPYPYGFIVDTTSPDGCNVDCFVLTHRPLKTGEVVECEPLGLMEQIEDGQEDHNVLAKPDGEDTTVTWAVEAQLTEFVCHVFDHIDGKKIQVGRFLGASEAEAHVAAYRDRP